MNIFGSKDTYCNTLIEIAKSPPHFDPLHKGKRE